MIARFWRKWMQAQAPDPAPVAPASLDTALQAVATAMQGIAELQASVQRVDARAGQLEHRLDELTRALALKATEQDVRHLRESLVFDLRRETQWLRDHLTALGGQVDRLATPSGIGGDSAGTSSGRSDAVPPAAAPAAAAPSSLAAEAAFYPALEQHFRGTREELQARQGVYRAWIDQAPPGPVADIGCGRGEWLELLATWGREARGVDTNAVLVAQGRERGLAMDQADAVTWLSQQPEASLAAITSFHVVEHLPFGMLLTLVAQARRALKPGGMIVLETPNPENLIVASHTFWTDPTHQRPIPPLLLDFIVLHGGFEVVAVPRLNPPDEASLPPAAEGALRQLLAQGRDYAVIGRKPQA